MCQMSLNVRQLFLIIATLSRPHTAHAALNIHISERFTCSQGLGTHMMLPKYHIVLYNDVALPRCDGYAISVINSGAALAANVSPNPMRKRAPMNMPIVVAEH